MLQQQSGCLRNAPVKVCFPGSGPYACYGNLSCQVVQEDETYDSGKGVRQIGVVFKSGGLKHCGFTGLSAEDPRSWYKRRYRPDECHKAGYLFTRVMLSTNEMPVVMRYEGEQSARSEQHRWVENSGPYLMPQDVEDTWVRVKQLKMSVDL